MAHIYAPIFNFYTCLKLSCVKLHIRNRADRCKMITAECEGSTQQTTPQPPPQHSNYHEVFGYFVSHFVRGRRSKTFFILTKGLLSLPQEYCLKYIVKESNWNQIVMSKDFESLDQPLMVQIIRRKELPPVKYFLEPHVDDINSELFFVLSFLIRKTLLDDNSKPHRTV